MPWPLQFTLFLQITTQGNQKEKELHLVPACLPDEEEGQPAVLRAAEGSWAVFYRLMKR